MTICCPRKHITFTHTCRAQLSSPVGRGCAGHHDVHWQPTWRIQPRWPDRGTALEKWQHQHGGLWQTFNVEILVWIQNQAPTCVPKMNHLVIRSNSNASTALSGRAHTRIACSLNWKKCAHLTQHIFKSEHTGANVSPEKAVISTILMPPSRHHHRHLSHQRHSSHRLNGAVATCLMCYGRSASRQPIRRRNWVTVT